MPREEKIKVIYETIANKERTFGCKYIIKDGDGHKYEVRETEGECVKLTYGDEYQVEYGDDYTRTNYLVSIIGHPVMIGDVLDWVSERMFDTTKGGEDFLIDDNVDDVVGYDYKLFSMRSKISSAVKIRWNYKRLPIEEQTDRCIDFIYSLISR